MTHQGLIIESKHVICFKYSSFDCARQNFCNVLLWKAKLPLK